MAEDNTTTTGGANTTPEPDYKALYEQAKENGRKWEERSKANKALADAHADYDDVVVARDVATSERDSLAKERDDLTAERDALRAQIARRDLLDRVSAATGVPASLLKGDSEEELSASAEAVKAYVGTQVPAYPEDKGGAATPKPETHSTIDSKPRETRAQRMERLMERAVLIDQETKR